MLDSYHIADKDDNDLDLTCCCHESTCCYCCYGSYHHRPACQIPDGHFSDRDSDNYSAECPTDIGLYSYAWRIVERLTPQLHESTGGLPSLKLSLHSCFLPGSTNAMRIETSIALVLPAREHECNGSFNLGRPPALL
ncbi:hypothetical protein Tco_1203188 [Tanacetum coccineum]